MCVCVCMCVHSVMCVRVVSLLVWLHVRVCMECLHACA